MKSDVTAVPSNRPLIPQPPSREVLLLDTIDDNSANPGEISVYVTPRSDSCRISFVAKALRDKSLSSIQLLDSHGKPAGRLGLAVRQMDGWLAGDTVLRRRGEFRFSLPRGVAPHGVGILINEDLTDEQWKDLQDHGSGTSVQVVGDSGTIESPMVRSVGKKVELAWEAADASLAASRTVLSLFSEGTVVGKVVSKDAYGTIHGDNTGSIQFGLKATPNRRYRLRLSFR